MYKKIKDKKGMATIEFVASILLILILFVFTYDTFRIAYKYYVANQQLNYIVRTIAIQGGVQSEVPTGFPGKYYTSSDIVYSIQDNFDRAGVKSDEYTVMISGNGKETKLNNNTNLKVDYKKGVNIEVKVKYNWTLFRNIAKMINNGERDLSVKRYAVSEFKYDYNNWEGEM